MTDIESKQAWSFHVVVHAYGIMFSDMFLTYFCDYGLVYRLGLMQEMHHPPPHTPLASLREPRVAHGILRILWSQQAGNVLNQLADHSMHTLILIRCSLCEALQHQGLILNQLMPSGRVGCGGPPTHHPCGHGH